MSGRAVATFNGILLAGANTARIAGYGNPRRYLFYADRQWPGTFLSFS
jgi:hypothetical protein